MHIHHLQRVDRSFVRVAISSHMYSIREASFVGYGWVLIILIFKIGMIGRLIIIDSIHPLLNPRRPDGPVHLPTYLSSFITTTASHAVHISLVVTYHRDMPSPSGLPSYSPSPLSILTYLATTIFTLHPLSQVLVQKAACDRSLAAPVFGLEEQQDGLIVGQLEKTKGQESVDGIVLEMEHRRRSGRYVVERYILPPAMRYSPQQAKEVVTLLDDHPLYRRPEESGEGVEDEITSTFELRLTDRQRREREGVVLPYFDAQQGNGPGEGGRILYDMGEEDDFDDEEDEI